MTSSRRSQPWSGGTQAGKLEEVMPLGGTLKKLRADRRKEQHVKVPEIGSSRGAFEDESICIHHEARRAGMYSGAATRRCGEDLGLFFQGVMWSLEGGGAGVNLWVPGRVRGSTCSTTSG